MVFAAENKESEKKNLDPVLNKRHQKKIAYSVISFPTDLL